LIPSATPSRHCEQTRRATIGASRSPLVGVIRATWAARPGRLLLWGLLVIAATTRSDASTGQVVSREYTIKAAYLYNFGRYVQWPKGAFRSERDPLEIGVLGTDPFGTRLDSIAATKKVEGRRIEVRRFAKLDQYAPCHILFVPRSVPPTEQVKTIAKLRGSPTLLVGETPSFAERGGVVNFYIEQNKIRFEINLETARKQELKINSKLLRLARLVGRAELPSSPDSRGGRNPTDERVPAARPWHAQTPPTDKSYVIRK